MSVGCLIICTAFLRFSDVTDVHTTTQCHINGENPQFPLKHFIIYVQLSLHTTFLPCMMEQKRVEWGEREHRVAHEQVNWDSISIKCPSEYGQCWIPCSLVVASVPQILQFMNTAKRRDLLHTNHTELISQQTNCSMSSAHERFVQYLVQRKMLFRMSMYELEF